MSLSYEYSIGSVRAKETSLLSKQDIDHLLALASEKEILAFLQSKGYGEGDSVDELLDSKHRKLWEYIHSVAPDKGLFDCFLIENDVHNLKSVMKGTLSQREYTQLLMHPTTIDSQIIIKAVSDQKFNLLPDWIAEPANKAYYILAHASDARMCDAILDKAASARMLALAAKGGDFLLRYFQSVVFFADIKLAIRLARTNADKDLLDVAVCEVDGLDVTALKKAAVKGEGAVIDVLAKINLYGCNKAIDAYKSGGGSAFEKQVDDLLIQSARQCRLASEGAQPLVGYLLQVENEIKTIHIIVSSVSTGLSAEQTRERLRAING